MATIPSTVTAEYNGRKKILNTENNWGAAGNGNYSKTAKLKDGRYKIAVAPKLLIPDYSDNGKLWSSDFGIDKDNEKYPTIQLVLKNKETGKTKKIECAVTDLKAHSYNKYPDGQPYNTGDTGSVDLPSGLIQTGLAYPNSVNATKNKASTETDMTGNIVEFATHNSSLDFNPNHYTLEEIIIIK